MRSLSIVLLGLVAASTASVLPEQLPFTEVTTTPPVRTTESWGWDNCGLPTDPIDIQSIEVYPDPPQPGKNLTVKVTGTAKEKIEEGATADVVVKVGVIKILTKTFDVCEEARKADASVQCPVEPGSYVVEQTVELPKEIPKAKFVVDIAGYTVDEDPMLCLKLTVNFMKRPFFRGW